MVVQVDHSSKDKRFRTVAKWLWLGVAAGSYYFEGPSVFIVGAIVCSQIWASR